MGLLSFLRQTVNRYITTTQQVGGRAVYPATDSETLISQAYSANAAIYTIVSYTSKKFAAVPRGVFKDDQKGQKAYRSNLKNGKLYEAKKAIKSIGDEILDSEYQRLMKRPNPLMGSDSFLEAVYLSKEILGEAFIWVNRGDSPVEGDARYTIKPLELWVLPAQYVEIISEENDFFGIRSYVLNANGTRVPLFKEDVIHWKTYNPNFDAATRSHLRGFSPLKAGNKLLTADDASKDAMVAMFQNDGAKGIVYNETLDNLTDSQKESIRGVVNAKVNNRDVKGAVATLQGKWGYIDLGKSSVDLDLMNSQDMTFARLCNLFRVSPNLFIAGQTRDNLREARKDLVTNKLMPDALSLDDELNRVLAKSFGGQMYVSDFSTLPEMQYDMGEMNTILKDMYDRGIISGNEYRSQMGWDETENAEHEQFFISANSVTLSEAAMTIDDTGDYTDSEQ